MSFVTQDDVHETMSEVIKGVFEEYSDWTGRKHRIEWLPNLRYEDAMLRYGSDKPDLRNPLEIFDVTDIFARDDVEFKAFKNIIEKGGIVRTIKAPNTADMPRSFFDKLNVWAQSEGAPGMAYISFSEGSGKGPIAKFLSEEAIDVLRENTDHVVDGDSLFFVCDMPETAEKFAGKAREAICEALPENHSHAREKNVFKFCWIVDFPMFDRDEDTGKIDFSHNPFSMPQGGLEAFETDPLDIYAYQYDCVCNGFELCSGAIRNHKMEIMEKAFSIAGYTKSDLEEKFAGMLNAFQYGAPPHGGTGFGIDRIVMLLADEPNLREINAFTYNGQGEDPLMGAPSIVSEEQLKDLHIKLSLPKELTKKDRAA
jgi:aspartyl-tRNA synthetase